MAAKNKKSVTTPLHLLQQLSHSLVEHLEKACEQAQADAEGMLAKLEKQRVKGQAKLHDARLKLQDAVQAGKNKAQAKARAAIDELEALLSDIKVRQTETRAYIAQLKRDAQESLKLAQGVGKVRDAAAKALDSRAAKAAQPAVKKPAAEGKTAAKAATPAASKAAARPTAAKPAAGTAARSPRKPAATPSAAKPATKPAAKAPASKPAPRATSRVAAKPAATTKAENSAEG